MLLQMAFTVLLCGTSQNLLCEWVVSCSFGVCSASVNTANTHIPFVTDYGKECQGWKLLKAMKVVGNSCHP